MMSRLTQYRRNNPEAVVIDDEEYTLNGSFRNALLTWEALTDDTLYDWEKADIVMGNMYTEPYPANVNEAIKQAAKYIMQRREVTEKDNKPLMCFAQDGQYIYDAFMSMGINLDKEDMTWWEFNSRLRELPKDCFFARLVYLRTLINNGSIYKKEHKQERDEIKRIGEDIVYLNKLDNIEELEDRWRNG